MDKIIQMSNLGYNGRFGNQLFQYSFIKSYSKIYNYNLQIPKEWIGRHIFKNINDAEIDRNLPKHYESDFSLYGKYNIDLDGQYTTRFHTKIIDRSDVKKWFEFKDEYQTENIIPNFEYNAIHLRRTDYTSTISKECVEYWVNFYDKEKLPTIIISDDPEIASNKEKFGIKKQNFNFNFIQDFFILSNAKNLFRSNSTFSWWASELSKKNNQKTYSPFVLKKLKNGEKEQSVDFLEGNHHMIANDFFIDFIKNEKFYHIYFGKSQE